MSPESAGPQPIVIHPEVTGDSDVAATTLPGAELPATSLPLAVVTITPDVAPVSSAPAETAATTAKRAVSVDALRGLFLILMTLGFTLRGDAYPLWMYHRQMPPPDYAIVDVPGISWRDLAYGAFLFTMAAALPLTLSRRIAKSETEISIMFGALKRYGMLMVFALLIGHANGYFIGYTQTARALAIAGFVIMALIFTRRRADWSETAHTWLTRAGWLLAGVFLVASPLLYGKTFAPTRIDDIIVGLAVASLLATAIWYFTRENLNARLAVLAVCVALYLGARTEGWIQSWWYASPAEWAFTPSMLSLMTVVLPGTIAGDVVLRWMRAAETSALAGWSRPRAIVLGLLCLTLTPVVVVGAYTRAVAPMTQLVLAMLLGGAILTSRPVSATEMMLRTLFVWSAVWLTIGLFLEPAEGGIRKVPETLSYFFTIAGLTTALLVALGVAIEALGLRTWSRPLVDVGQNPLLAYVLFTVLINSALEMIEPLRGFMRGSPGLSFLRSVLSTVAVVLIVGAFTRRKVFWRT
jgi:predicted acyltransferase